MVASLSMYVVSNTSSNSTRMLNTICLRVLFIRVKHIPKILRMVPHNARQITQYPPTINLNLFRKVSFQLCCNVSLLSREKILELKLKWSFTSSIILNKLSLSFITIRIFRLYFQKSLRNIFISIYTRGFVSTARL